ncbi:MAG: hypothetical protein RL088_398 [Verrucomicrobiota bacterium]|jgi:mono/diheme cytochrome c family protein
MQNRTFIAATLCLAAHSACAGDAASIWARKVQPLFDVQCVKCHGPIEQKGGLELDTVDSVLKGGDSGAVVIPGKPEASALFHNLAPDADPHMPPKKQLSDGEREIVREWISALEKSAAPVAQKTVRDFPNPTTAIDSLIAEGWERNGVQPAAPLSDRAWCRRVYLDLAGRIPTTAEVDSFLAAPAESRRATLVDKLIASDDYAVRMRELWDVFLMGRGRRGNIEDRRKQNGWWDFLETSFRTNRPWNETVRELLVARPAKPENKGATWFLYDRKNDHQQIAEAVAPVVYGTTLDCAQCHDHPLAREIKQAHYWGLVAAFNRSKNVEGSTAVAESAVGGFVNFTNLKKESQPAIVTLLSGKTIAETWPAGDKKEDDGDDKYVDPKAKVRVPKTSRREAFADAATNENPLLARAFVNRMWAALLGRGIVHPANEMNARNVPSHPELLDWLAADFAKSGHDARRIIRGIVLSRAYSLGRSGAAPETFAGTPERPLTAEQLSRSWRIAAGLPAGDDTLRRATIAAMPDVLPREYNATFQQAQFLTNSPALAAVLKPAPGNTAERLEKIPDSSARVREAFRAVLDREPDSDELAAASRLSPRDLLWALMTSAEFLITP